MTAVTVKRFTTDEYHRLGELDFFGEDDRVELIRGEIFQRPKKKPPHAVCNTGLWQSLFKLIEENADIRVQEPISLPPDSEPQPDVVIARNKSDKYLSGHPEPGDIFLVIEIADATLSYDQKTKLSLYAENRITDYWIVDLVNTQLEAYSRPYQDSRGNFGYASKQVFFPDALVPIPGFPNLYLKLADIFPGEIGGD